MASSIACSRTVDLGRYRQRFTGQTKKKEKVPISRWITREKSFDPCGRPWNSTLNTAGLCRIVRLPQCPRTSWRKKKRWEKFLFNWFKSHSVASAWDLLIVTREPEGWRAWRETTTDAFFFYRWEEMIFSLCLSLSSLEYRRGRIKSICYRVKHKAIENYRAPFFSDRLGGTCIQLERWGWRDFFFICSLRLMPMDEISPNKSFLGWSILTLRCRL